MPAPQNRVGAKNTQSIYYQLIINTIRSKR